MGTRTFGYDCPEFESIKSSESQFVIAVGTAIIALSQHPQSRNSELVISELNGWSAYNSIVAKPNRIQS